MRRHFSPQELFVLRNQVPIDTLIEKHLKVPSKFSEGYFRFLCPFCHEFQTATNRRTNLGRCFRCERNFNTIDIVMICKGIRFVECVKYLKSISNHYR
jgi:hypothetical protein